MVNVTFKADENCQVLCDGDFVALLDANQITKEQVPSGDHVLTFISIDDPTLSIEKTVSFPIPGKSHLVLVNEFIQLRRDRKREAAQQYEQQMNAPVEIPYTLFGMKGTFTTVFRHTNGGEPCGFGKWVAFDNHITYEGELGRYDNGGKVFRDGELIYEGGILPDGTYHCSQANFVKYPEGIYSGEIRNGIRTGSGFIKFNNGDKYSGKWKDDLPNGDGTYTPFPYNSISYDGTWKNGVLIDGERVDASNWGRIKRTRLLIRKKLY